MGAGAGAGAGSDVDSDVGSDVGAGAGAGAGSDVDSDVGSDVGAGAGAGAGSDVDSDVGSDVGASAVGFAAVFFNSASSQVAISLEKRSLIELCVSQISRAFSSGSPSSSHLPSCLFYKFVVVCFSHFTVGMLKLNSCHALRPVMTTFTVSSLVRANPFCSLDSITSAILR